MCKLCSGHCPRWSIPQQERQDVVCITMFLLCKNFLRETSFFCDVFLLLTTLLPTYPILVKTFFFYKIIYYRLVYKIKKDNIRWERRRLVVTILISGGIFLKLLTLRMSLFLLEGSNILINKHFVRFLRFF